jgi:purine nucleosidase
MPTLRLVLDVDTGTDDAGALLLAATCPAFDLVAATGTWGNCARDQAVRNTLVVLEAAGRAEVPVHAGGGRPRGGAPSHAPAETEMGRDGLADVGTGPPRGEPDPEPAAHAIVRLAAAHPGELTLVALAPLTTVADALDLDPELPRRLRQLIVMGGAVASGGNLTAAAEANIGHDPEAAALVADAFGAPGPRRTHRRPRLVPLDVTLAAPLTEAELDAVAASELPGAGLLHAVWRAVWPTGRLETGQDGVWPAHDLLALWCAIDHTVCEWRTWPLAVDTGGGAAWGATVADRRSRASPTGRADNGPAGGWDVAVGVDARRYRDGVRAWLSGRRR